MSSKPTTSGLTQRVPTPNNHIEMLMFVEKLTHYALQHLPRVDTKAELKCPQHLYRRANLHFFTIRLVSTKRLAVPMR